MLWDNERTIVVERTEDIPDTTPVGKLGGSADSREWKGASGMLSISGEHGAWNIDPSSSPGTKKRS